jgi:CopG family transcriptional regulator, nickel-responsive regulator
MIPNAAARGVVAEGNRLCMAVLGYVFEYETRALAQSLSRALHEHHDLVVSAMRVSIDHRGALEISVPKGPPTAGRGLAGAITVERGVRHASLHLVPVRESGARHDYGTGHGTDPHAHIHA